MPLGGTLKPYKRGPGHGYAERSKGPERGLVLARHLGANGKIEEALELCERAWQTCPPERVVAKQSGPAIQDLEAAIKNMPTASRYLHLARAYDLAGDPTKARQAFDKAEELDVATRLQPLEQKTYRALREKYSPRPTGRSGRPFTGSGKTVPRRDAPPAPNRAGTD
jgi:tetratricopeptide (TPR) repeat protein